MWCRFIIGYLITYIIAITIYLLAAAFASMLNCDTPWYGKDWLKGLAIVLAIPTFIIIFIVFEVIYKKYHEARESLLQLNSPQQELPVVNVIVVNEAI